MVTEVSKQLIFSAHQDHPVALTIFLNFKADFLCLRISFKIMKKRSDHVSLCATSAATAPNNAAGKKLRKRRELDKMAAVNNINKNRQTSTRNSAAASNSDNKKLLNTDNRHLSFSSSDDEYDDDEDDIRHHDGEAYIHLKASKRGGAVAAVGAKYHWLKRNQKLIKFCHKSCYFFVVLSGFLVLLTLAWLHFALRAQTQDINAQLRQGADFQTRKR